jgi:hypothetical protein
MRIEKLPVGVELDKRTFVPAMVYSNCPHCGKEYERDLSSGDHYLSYPVTGQPVKVYFYCEDCHPHDWVEWVVLRMTLEPSAPPPNKGGE